MSEDGGQICWTLERSYERATETGVVHEPKVPLGTYRCVRGLHRLSDGVPFETFELLKVPGRTGILFHKGNWEKDSHGCILLGMEKIPNGIGHSLAAFRTFMQAQAGVDEFYLTVEDEQ